MCRHCEIDGLTKPSTERCGGEIRNTFVLFK
jgi:hypothetical protein